MNVLRGETLGAGRRVAIVASRFNELVTSKLVEGARGGLSHHGVVPEDVTVAWVPGAFEIPPVAQRLAESGRFDAVICLGAVIRGETSHFDLIAAEAARGISEVGRTTGVPCIFEVLATDTLDQAEARAGGVHGNKGWEAASAALEMASVVAHLRAEGVGR
ncbi:MAG: 6,7-dimethyl-8-ribityllumazine synthase [Actinobacteria bacterium]|nr:MAG: 6,7-dimethyl-8-ribityllumazine synthase [Actinomycetota bacterium]